jgi:NADPH:quinone reductase-like Zn-dependent oxidoreductase
MKAVRIHTFGGPEVMQGRHRLARCECNSQQLAKQCGARVFGTVSTEEKAALARAVGADAAILYAR